MKKKQEKSTPIYLIAAIITIIVGFIAIFTFVDSCNRNGIKKNQEIETSSTRDKLLGTKKDTLKQESKKPLTTPIDSNKYDIKEKLLFISSIPSSADIYINEKFIGRTNMKYFVKEYDYNVKLIKANYDTLCDIINVKTYRDIDTIIKSYTLILNQ